VSGGLEFVLRAVGRVLIVLILVVIVVIKDGDEFLKFFPHLHLIGGNLLVADME
jgi:hypothetical protein